MKAEEINTTNVNVTGLLVEGTYTVSIVTTSSTLPSTDATAPYDVAIGRMNVIMIVYNVVVIQTHSAPYNNCEYSVITCIS